MKKLLGRDVRVPALNTKIVELPEYECSVILRELQLDQLTSVSGDVVAQLSLMIVDEDGNLMFTTPEQIRELSMLSASIGKRLLEAAAEVNGISKEAIEAALKNSQASRTEGLGSV